MPRGGLNKLNLVGQHFDRLIVIGGASPAKNGKARWRCDCQCGASIVAVGVNLRNGHTRSCGCLQRERTSEAKLRHGQTESRLYTIWTNMRQRCGNPGGSHFADYGGRGIRVCSEWESFERFQEWALGAGYNDELTIDRIDNDGNYEPSNCRWADWFVQARNRRPAKLQAFADHVVDEG